ILSEYTNEYDSNYVNEVTCDMLFKNNSDTNQSSKPNLKDLQLVPINMISGKS
ncbi:6797_t:CDS:1, partial [Cetraspora pellucida]